MLIRRASADTGVECERGGQPFGLLGRNVWLGVDWRKCYLHQKQLTTPPPPLLNSQPAQTETGPEVRGWSSKRWWWRGHASAPVAAQKLLRSSRVLSRVAWMLTFSSLALASASVNHTKNEGKIRILLVVRWGRRRQDIEMLKWCLSFVRGLLYYSGATPRAKPCQATWQNLLIASNQYMTTLKTINHMHKNCQG